MAMLSNLGSALESEEEAINSTSVEKRSSSVYLKHLNVNKPSFSHSTGSFIYKKLK